MGGQVPPREGEVPVKMGHVCFIPNTKDFFIAYGDHPEWGQSPPGGGGGGARMCGGAGRC